MAVRDFTVRMSGTVAYSDNTHGSFEASAMWRGNLGNVVATHASADSLEHFKQLFGSEAASVNLIFAVFPGTVTITTAAPTTQKEVTSFTMEISGLVATDTNTKHGFVAQWIDGVVNLFPAETDEAWALITDSTSGKSFLDSVLEACAGSGKVAIS